MEVYELCEAPENMAFYVHGQGHAIEHDSRQLIVTIQTLCRRFDFPCCAVFSARQGSCWWVKCCVFSAEKTLARTVGGFGGSMVGWTST